MPDVILHLPICPPLNHLFCNLPYRRGRDGKQSGGGRARTQRYRAWVQAAGWDVAQAKAAPIAGPVKVEIAVPMGMRGDLDGRAKAAIDLVVEHGLIEDDDRVHELLMRRAPEMQAGRMLVVVREHRPFLYQRERAA